MPGTTKTCSSLVPADAALGAAALGPPLVLVPSAAGAALLPPAGDLGADAVLGARPAPSGPASASAACVAELAAAPGAGTARVAASASFCNRVRPEPEEAVGGGPVSGSANRRPAGDGPPGGSAGAGPDWY